MTTYEELGIIKANESVIPEGCLSFAEQTLYVAEYSQNEYNKLFEAVGVEELAVFEATGSLVVYEGATLDSFKEKAKKFFLKIWAAIKAAYEKVYAFFIQKSKTAMEQIKGLDKAAVKVALEADPGKNYGITHNYDDLIKTYNRKVKEAAGLCKSINSKFDAADGKYFSGDIATTAKTIGRSENTKQEVIEKLSEDMLTEIAETFGKKDSKTLSDIKDAIREELKEIDVTGSYLKSHIDDFVKIVKDGKSIDDIKVAYQEQKKVIDESIKAAGKLKEENMRSASKRIMVLGKLSNALDVCANTYFDIFKKRFTEYLLILVRVWKVWKKATKEKEKEKAANESYSYDMVSEAFNW